MTTVAEACDRWVTYRSRMVSLALVERSTFGNQSRVAKQIKADLGKILLDDLRKSDLDIWVGERLQTCKPVTVRAELNVFRQILNWCVDEQLLGQRPRLPTVQVPQTELSLPGDEAYLWALRSVPQNHRDALELMMLTGLSPHEAERVQVRDWKPNPIDPKGPGWIGVGQRGDFRVKTESRRRYVSLNDRAKALWDKMTLGCRPLEHPFPSGAAMQKALARARAADSGAPEDSRRITPKMMRQWFASQVAADDTPEHVLQRLLGHAPGSNITRRHYVRSTDDQAQKATAGLTVGTRA